ncbi:tRNA (adenosine(37)-N6)-threonylcarbamoyltransferase complex ATPase subunit type 1 TsaE [bacterium]|nr:tRNA (adenosine(37)-N6)-threonylcarbamoyltransferase complex ATPase subunit type 1 TsaE [bacterium]
MNKIFTSNSIAETHTIAKWFADEVKAGEIISLVGEMGVGKTEFVRGLAKILGYEGAVRSPSFTLLNHYPSTPAIVHADLYRLKSTDELIALNLEAEAEDAILLVEWGDKFDTQWGSVDWMIKISDDQNTNERIVEIRKLNQ